MSMIAYAHKIVLSGYFSVRTAYPIWYNLLNRKAVSLHNKYQLPLSSEGERIVRELMQYGVAVTSLEALFPEKNWLEIFQTWETTHQPKEDATGRKKFLRHYWDLVPTLDLDNPFLRFSIDERILSIGHHYMGMWLRMRGYSLARTLPDPELTPARSQRWHRDPEEKKWFKCFVYLNDVDETAGPFTYARGTNWDGPFRNVGPQKPLGGSYPPEDEVEDNIPKENIRVMTGKAGTVIFCDVAGLHFGGRATHKPRIMFTACYNAPSFSEGCHFRWSEKVRQEAKHLSSAAQFALDGRLLKQGDAPMMG